MPVPQQQRAGARSAEEATGEWRLASREAQGRRSLWRGGAPSPQGERRHSPPLAAETRLTPLRAPPPALALSGRPISGGGLAAVAMAAVPVATTAVARR